MRRAALVAIAVLLGCSFDWDAFDPRLGGAEGGAAGASSGAAGAAGAPDGGGGAGGAACGAGEELCDGACVSVESDPDHCGGCTTQCLTNELCFQGTCQTAASCKELHQGRPALGDGTYTLAPASVATFAAHCDMTIEGGGWTLVASVVDNSYFTGTACDSACSPSLATICDESPFTSSSVVGNVADFLALDHKSAAYGSVPFDEMLFVDSNGHYVSYDVSGASVLAWYPAGLENWVAEGTEAHATYSYPAKATDLDPALNACGTLRVSFNVEDSDSPVGGTCHTSVKGPSWSAASNNACFWDDGGVPWTWGAFYQSNTSSYRTWLVR